MAHNEDLPQFAIDGQTPERNMRRDNLPHTLLMADLDPRRQNPHKGAREKRSLSPRHSRSPDRQRRQTDTQVLEDRVREQDELIRRMAVDMEALKRQVKGKGVAKVEIHEGRTQSRCSGDQDRHATPTYYENRSLRTGDTHSRTSRTPLLQV